MDIDAIRKEMKRKRKGKHNSYKENKIPKYSGSISRFLITILLTLLCLISFKVNPALKPIFYKYIYEDHLKFTYFQKKYKQYFGNILPDKLNKTEPVFNEKLNYKTVTKYEDGCQLQVTNNYLIPALDSGMVVFIGSKDKLNNTVIIQQINGIDVWYGNINTSSVKLYDYVEKGTLVGETKDDKLYLVFKKDGTILNYEDYL